MSVSAVSRPVESRAVEEFLAAVPFGPSALVVEGEAGIGKTTVWSAALQRATDAGFRVLSTRATSAESVLAYAALADLLDSLDDAAFAELPPPQRLAIDRVLLRASIDGPVTDQRAVGAALVSVAERLAELSPVLIAIDDLQWLDPASKLIMSLAVRRFSGPIGLLTTVRAEPEHAGATSWLELRRPERLQRIQVRPLSLGATHAVLSEQLGRSFSRPKVLRVHTLSEGNPFYAVELGRVMDDAWTEDTALPPSLAELVRVRLSRMAAPAREALLAAACLAAPTLELIARATDADAMAALEEAESSDVVQIDGHRVTFTHPLIRRGVYTDATPTQRRAMHQRLAELVDEPELKARHLALAAESGDQPTLESLDAAAEMARIRGAPAAAAELLHLAMGLGGDTAERRILAAAHHYDAGDPARARSLLVETIDRLDPGAQRAQAMLLLATIQMYDDSFLDAAALLESALVEPGEDPAVQVRTLVMLAYALFNSGQAEAGLRRADEAVGSASRLDQPELLGQALGMRTTLRYVIGEGLDETDMRRARELADYPVDLPLAGRPAVQNALLLAWTGQLDDAEREIAAIRDRCVERGEDSELIFLGFHSALLHVWRGELIKAERVAADIMELALQLNGDMPLFIALTIKSTHGAYAGLADEVRRDAADALSAAQRCGSRRLSEWPITNLGFLEVSLGNYEAALSVLAPLLAGFDRMSNSTEIIAASFVPDAAEAMIGLGQLSDAERIIDVLEGNGRRLDRAWMLAAAGRSRAMLLAARGDIEGATEAVRGAMEQHRRLAMPFEQARTELVSGQIQRRQRQREAASATLRKALATFEELGTPLWADRARAELSRVVRTRAELTSAEQRVAELAATGITNREMASALFISPKTVEANLSRVYRKLGIRSRAELGRIMGQADE